jgi:hypothetical protein
MKSSLKIKLPIFLMVIMIVIISISSFAVAMDEETAQEIIDQWIQEGNVDERGGVYVEIPFSTMYFDNVLIALWELYGFPDDAGGLFYDSDTGMMGFLLVDPTPERIAELRRLAGVDIVIESSKYSWNELNQVHEEITALLDTDSGIFFISTGWTSTDGVVHGFGENRKEMRVEVGVDESMYEYYSILFAELYDDMVILQISEQGFRLQTADLPISDAQGSLAINEGANDLLIADGTDALVDDFHDTIITNDSILYEHDILVYDNNTFWTLYIILGFCLLGTLSILIVLKTRRIPAMQTTSNGVVPEVKAAGREQVIAAVKYSGNAPRDSLLETIIEHINNSAVKNNETIT